MDKIDVYLESAIAVLQTKSIGHMAALRAAGSIIALAEVEHGKLIAAQQSFAPDSLKAGDSSLPDVVKSENALPAEGG